MEHLVFLWLIARLYQLQLDYSPFLVEQSVTYKYTEHRTLELDVFLPEGQATPVPAVVIVHGGAWVTNTRRDHYPLAAKLAESGIAAIPISFRRLPPGGPSGQVKDIKDAVQWVRAHAPAYGIDPRRIGIFGSSSGGHLAALAAFASDGEGLGDDSPGTSSEVQAACLLYGLYDFRAPPEPLDAEGTRLVDQETLKKLSPIAYVDGSEPSTLLLHGTRDRVSPIEVVHGLHAALKNAGVEAELRVYEGLGHGFAKTKPWLEPMVFAEIEAYFGRVLHAKRPPAQ